MCKIQSTFYAQSEDYCARSYCLREQSETDISKDPYGVDLAYMVNTTANSWRGMPRPEESEKELPTSTEAKELKENTVNNLWSQQQQRLPLIYAEGGHLACVTINLRLDKAGSSEKRFSAFSEAQGRPTANRARIWNHDLNYFTSSKQIQWRPQTSTAGRRSSQQIEGASSQASGQGGVSVPPPTNQFRSV